MFTTIQEYILEDYQPIPMKGNERSDFSPGTPEFKAWFGDSKIKNKKGYPLALYHGSPDIRWTDNDDAEFATSRKRYSGADDRECYYFTNDKNTALSYANNNRAFDDAAKPGVKDFYLRVVNPLCIDCGNSVFKEVTYRVPQNAVISDSMKRYVSDEGFIRGSTSISLFAKDNNYDGVIFYNVKDHYDGNAKVKTGSVVVSVFNPNQIKSHYSKGFDDSGRIYY